MRYRLGVDIGGTFTDFCFADARTGKVRTLKALSTPDSPGEEIIAGLREAERRYGIAAGDIGYFTHGTTVGVNTVIARSGINLCLFATHNFEDVLEVARLKMPDPYNLFSRRPSPLVTREKVFGIEERIAHDGSVAAALDEGSVLRAIEGVRKVGGEGVVIAFLHAYANPAHEQAVRDIVRREAPDLHVSCASEVWPVIREYERTATAVVAAYAQPRIARYLASLEDALHCAGVDCTAMITKSNGGVTTARAAARDCAQVLLSGTAAGVIGASHVARLAGIGDCMSLDVGGTSADVALVRDANPAYGVGELIGEFPIFIPTVSVTSIGEGGGSIAWVDDLGVLKVGPESAGSSPGPACYGLGGERPTLTDAFVVCGLLGNAQPGSLDLGYGAVRIDGERARRALETLTVPLSRSVEATAQAIIRVAVAGMYLEVSKLFSRHGIDAQALTLQAFGGAGPMLGEFVARELGMRRMVVPPTPGVLSAFGGLIADVKGDFIRTVFADLNAAAVPQLQATFAALRKQAEDWLRLEQSFTGEARFVLSADMRYRGQSFEIETPLEASWVDSGDIAAMAQAFHTEHARVYEHADEDATVQIVNLRMVAVGAVPKPVVASIEQADAPPEVQTEVSVWIDGARHTASLYARHTLLAGHRFEGPAIISQDDCTTCVLPGSIVTVDGHANLVIEVGVDQVGVDDD